MMNIRIIQREKGKSYGEEIYGKSENLEDMQTLINLVTMMFENVTVSVSVTNETENNESEDE